MASPKSKLKGRSYGFQFVEKLGDFLNRYVRRFDHGDESLFIKYGHDNRFPQEAIELVGNNPIAKQAMRKRARYIFGDGGFVSEADRLKDAGGKTANQLLQRIAVDVALFQGFALQIARDGSGNISKVDNIPFEWIRKHPEGGLSVNRTLGTNKEKKEWERYPEYRGKAQIALGDLALMKSEFNGNPEIAYFYTADPMSFDYPVPDWFAGEFDVRTDTELMLLDNEMATNGFMPSGIMTFPGDIDDETEDEDGKTAADYRDDTLKQFTGNARNPNTGKSSRMRLMVFDVPDRESAPIFEPLNIEKIINGSTDKRDDVSRRVCRLFGIHPVLMGFSEATVLGNQQALANASEEASNDVRPDQEMITEAFKDVFDGEFVLSSYKPVNFIPDRLLDVLTPDEKREMVGYEPNDINVKGDNERILDTLNSLSPLLAASVVKAMKTEALLELVGIDPSKAKPESEIDNTDETVV